MGYPSKTDFLHLCICPCVYVSVLVFTCIGKLVWATSREQCALLTTELPLQPLQGLLKWAPFSFPFFPIFTCLLPSFPCIFFSLFDFFSLFHNSLMLYFCLSGFELMISQSGGTLYLTRQTRKQRAFPASFNFLLLLWDSLTLQHRLASASPSPPSDFWDNRTMLPCVDLTMHFT